MINTAKSLSQLQIAGQARVAGAEMSVGNLLGEQLLITPKLLKQNPELAKLLAKSPQAQNFDQVLAKMVSPDTTSQSKDALSAKPTTHEQLVHKSSLKKLEKSPNSTLNSSLNSSLKSSSEIINKQSLGQSVPTNELKSLNIKKQSALLSPDSKKAVNDSKTQKAHAQLMDFNTFMSKQGARQNTTLAKSAYKNKTSESMFAKKMEEHAPSLTNSVKKSSEKTALKISDLMLMDDSSNMEQAIDLGYQQNLNKTVQAQSQVQTQKVFDMNQFNSNQDVINQVQDYIIQAKASSEPSVQMSFAHSDLGMVDLVVQKAQGDQISIMINSHSLEGAKFFNQNQGDLLQSLGQSGINVTELKLESSKNMSAQDQEGSFNQNSRNSQQQASDERQQRNQDSDRRQELWNLLNNKEAA